MKKQISFLMLVTILTISFNMVSPSYNILAQKNTEQFQFNIIYNTAKFFPKRLMEKHNKINKIAQTSNYYLIEELSQDWQNDEWIDSSNTIYTYDEHGMLKEMIMQRWQNDEWVDFIKTINTYDEQSNFTGLIAQIWQNDEWIDSNKAINTYDELGNFTEIIMQIWQNDEWVDYSKAIYTYDELGTFSGLISQDWQNEEWIDSSKNIYIYDEQGYMTEELSQDWQNDEWVDSSRIIKTYASLTTYIDENNTLERYILFSNYPNPFNQTTTITYRMNQPGMVNLVIYDLLGRKVNTLVDEVKTPGSYSVTWNSRDFATGVYFYRIELGGSKVSTQKMTLVK